MNQNPFLLGTFLVLACGACVHGFHNLPLSHERVETAGQLKHLQTIGFSSLKQKALTNSTIDGNILPLGIYWTPVYLGVPVRGPFQLAIDTGSTDLMVPGVGCDGCVTEVTSPYDPSQSAGYTPLTCATTKVHCKGCLLSPSGPCRFLNSYETCDLADPTKSCTIEGPLITDQAGFSDSQSATTDMVLGVIMNQTSNFQQLQYIDGIVGFSFPGSSAFGYHSLFQSLFTAGIYSENVFAMCLTPNHGGILTLGGTDPTLYSGSIPWTPVVSTRSFTLTFSGIQVEGTALSVPSGTVIIDSGTNNLLLDNERFTAVQDAIQTQLCGSKSVSAPQGVCNGNLFSGSCFPFSLTQVKQFPVISLLIGGGLGNPTVPLTLSPSEYLLAPNATSTELCYGVGNTGASFNIIGDVVMQKYYTVFDIANNRIGWPLNTHCSTQ